MRKRFLQILMVILFVSVLNEFPSLATERRVVPVKRAPVQSQTSADPLEKEGIPENDVSAREDGSKQEAESLFGLEINIVGQRILGDQYEEVTIQNGTSLKSNDNFQIHVRPSKDCYLYVLIYDSEGKAVELFPSEMTGFSNRIVGNKSYKIPAEDNWFFLDEKTGAETIYILADIEPMTDIDRLLADMEKKGCPRQHEDSQKILSQIDSHKRGISYVGPGRIQTFNMTNGDTINNVTQVVKGRGGLVWSVSFNHI